MSPAAAAPGDARAAALERRLGEGAEVKPHEETGKVRFIGTEPGDPIAAPNGASPPAAARAFLEDNAKAFGLDDASRELRVEATDDLANGRSSVRLQQLHRGVPVIAGELVVNLDRRDDVLSVSGEVAPIDRLDVTPAVSAVAAEATAVDVAAKAHRGVPRASLDARAARLSIHDSRVLGGPGTDQPTLVWRVEVTARGGEPVRELVLVSAERGNPVLHFNQLAHAKNRHVCDGGNTPAQYPCTTPVRAEGGPPHPLVADVNQAYDFAGDTYDFFFSRFGRDSLDGSGMTIKSTVRHCDPGSPCPWTTPSGTAGSSSTGRDLLRRTTWSATSSPTV